MRADKRLWRTEKDGEFVVDADPKAVMLAYAEGDEVDPEDEAAAKKALGKGADKQAVKAQDKQADPPANKASAKRPARKS